MPSSFMGSTTLKCVAPASFIIRAALSGVRCSLQPVPVSLRDDEDELLDRIESGDVGVWKPGSDNEDEEDTTHTHQKHLEVAGSR